MKMVSNIKRTSETHHTFRQLQVQPIEKLKQSVYLQKNNNGIYLVV
jgi:hypothetical protein